MALEDDYNYSKGSYMKIFDTPDPDEIEEKSVVSVLKENIDPKIILIIAIVSCIIFWTTVIFNAYQMSYYDLLYNSSEHGPMVQLMIYNPFILSLVALIRVLYYWKRIEKMSIKIFILLCTLPNVLFFIYYVLGFYN